MRFLKFCEFKNNNDLFLYWMNVLKTRDLIKNQEIIEYAKLTDFQLNLTNIQLKLTNKQLTSLILTFYSVDYYETFGYLFDFVKLNKEIAMDF